MTGAEFAVLRRMCGLSALVAAQLFNVSLQTIAFWEDGCYPIDPATATRLRHLNGNINHVAKYALSSRLTLKAMGVEEPNPPLILYRSPKDYAGCAMELNGIPFAAHHAAIGRTMMTLEAAGLIARVEWFTEQQPLREPTPEPEEATQETRR